MRVGCCLCAIVWVCQWKRIIIVVFAVVVGLVGCVCDGDCAFSLISGGDGACGDVAPVDAGHVALLVMVAAAE
jgi:hypothetical protein